MYGRTAADEQDVGGVDFLGCATGLGKHRDGCSTQVIERELEDACPSASLIPRGAEPICRP